MYCNSLDINNGIKSAIKMTMDNYNDSIRNNKQLFIDCYIQITADVIYSHTLIHNLTGYVSKATKRIIENYNKDYKKGFDLGKHELKNFLFSAIEGDIINEQ